MLASASLLLFAAACGQELAVENLSNPDVGRVFAAAQGVEATIASGYQATHNAITNTALQPEVEVMALESYSSLNNFNMGVRVSIPRNPIQNSNGAPSVFGEYSSLERAARLMVNAIDALNLLQKSSPSGTALADKAGDLRAKSFAYFAAGVDLGWTALIYDSTGIVTPGMASDSIPPLSAAADVMKVAISFLDSAFNLANTPAADGANGFPIPAAWVGGTSMTRDQFLRFIRSYRARFRAGVARTPAQRAAVDWAKIIDDTENGIQANVMMVVGGTTGWNIGFNSSQMHVDPGWSQMSMMYFGMADTSGGYANFIKTPLATRDGYFLVKTPDKRWPSGETRTAQQNFAKTPPAFGGYPYIINRTLAEVPGDGWGISFYDFFRLKYIRLASGTTGPYPEFTKAENDLLAAEAYIRTGDVAKATAKIDISRVAAGLPKLSGVITSATGVVAGGARSVPQVTAPAGTGWCGERLEGLK
jgi:hypothetical protein